MFLIAPSVWCIIYIFDWEGQGSTYPIAQQPGASKIASRVRQVDLSNFFIYSVRLKNWLILEITIFNTLVVV